MSIENITSKILSDAQDYANSSLMDAEKTKQEILNRAKNEAEVLIKTEAEKAANDALELKNRKVSAAELQGRKMLLSAKQEAINKSFDAAIEKLKAMPEVEYLNFLVQEVVRIPNCQGSIVLNAKDRESIGERLVKAVNEKLGAEKVALSKDTVETSGGFVLKRGKVEINSTFETLLDAMRDQLTSEIADVLFK
ncbi:MAG TPA: V-type ATP synthase subunit E [Sedimentibacter sp.]|jgi:V/A-type H+-transporting ATPase subunit E|nr:V-type ATP synthase subunit E [Sedimentibacter sp.]HOK49797.1 V-type ATP synthase subunit E [Sedimentibacter sp.]HOW23244.1 V-type ATP synthase subunit E [Sedimentibacter sp.]HRC81002.1 V-type ATP synthase subunit E [Sedimentibacter sp.]